MLARYAPAVINQARAFMLPMGYIMALAAFFGMLAQFGEITLPMRVAMYVLLAVPILYALALAVEPIAREREHT